MVITILEDNPVILAEALGMVKRLRPSYTVYTFSDIASFLSEGLNATDILISDICLEDGDAVEALSRVQYKNDNIKIIYKINYCINTNISHYKNFF